MSYSLGNTPITAGTPTKFNAPNDGVKAILIGNESGLTCTITMESGGVQKTLYPGVLDWFAVNKGFTGNILISSSAILSNVSSYPSSDLLFDAIGINDSEQASMYPLSLPGRNTNVGNTVSTVGTANATAIINDGNVVGTQIVESTPAGDAHSTVSLNNEGNLVLGDSVHPGSITSDNGAFATDGTGFLTLLNLLFTGGKLGKVTAGDILDASGGTSLTLKSINGDVIIQNGTTEIGRFTSGTNGGALNLPGAQRSINGSTTGTCTCYQLNVGPLKICAFYFSNWRNGSAGNQFISIPVAMTSSIHGLNGGCGTFQVIKSGSAQTVQILTTLASGGGGVSGVTSVNNNCIWHVDSGFDSLALAGSDAGTHNGIILMFGI